MYDLDLVRELCGMIAAETDPEKTDRLLSILRSVIRAENDEARLRIRYIVNRYAPVLSDSLAS